MLQDVQNVQNVQNVKLYADMLYPFKIHVTLCSYQLADVILLLLGVVAYFGKVPWTKL